jgi:hypothetical protein
MPPVAVLAPPTFVVPPVDAFDSDVAVLPHPATIATTDTKDKALPIMRTASVTKPTELIKGQGRDD